MKSKKEVAPPPFTVKVYHGYGHTNNCTLFGHVFAGAAVTRNYDRSSIWQNILHLVRLFMLRPQPGIPVRLTWNQQHFYAVTESDGFFSFSWSSDTSIPAGWHSVLIDALTENGEVISSGTGKLFIPHLTQLAIISDIDDTVLVSHSSTILKRLVLLFTRNPRSRQAFAGIVEFYQQLAYTYTEVNIPNPFFYVSSSEWNLYDDLVDFFRFNHLPEGSFLLNQVKRWYDLWKTGKTKHEGKLLRIVRILEAFPQQRFMLVGDNSQSDPGIYQSIVHKYHGRIVAVFIRSVVPEHDPPTELILHSISEKGIPTHLFKDSQSAIIHAKSIFK
jgi:phosphatidate phosphatase APP1